MGTFDKLSPLLWGLAFLSPVVAIFFAVRFYALHCRRRPEPSRRFPMVAYVVVLLVCAIMAYLGGLFFGVSAACSAPRPGNLCGLFGLFVTGPFAASLAIFLVSGLIMLLPADEAASIPAVDAYIPAKSTWYHKLWHGEYSLAYSFWVFFILGTLVGRIIGMNPALLFGTRLIFEPVFLGYQITAGVGVWRSANTLIVTRGGAATLADSVKATAAKTVVVLLIGVHGILLIRTFRILIFHSHL